MLSSYNGAYTACTVKYRLTSSLIVRNCRQFVTLDVPLVCTTLSLRPTDAPEVKGMIAECKHMTGNSYTIENHINIDGLSIDQTTFVTHATYVTATAIQTLRLSKTTSFSRKNQWSEPVLVVGLLSTRWKKSSFRHRTAVKYVSDCSTMHIICYAKTERSVTAITIVINLFMVSRRRITAAASYSFYFGFSRVARVQ